MASRTWNLTTRDVLTVVNTPIERARLYFRYRPIPNLLAAADPDRVSHWAFGLPNLEFTQEESGWPRKVAMSQQAHGPRRIQPSPGGLLLSNSFVA